MAKTVVEKVNSPNSDVSIFKISGVLGYHENAVLTKFFCECVRKGMTRLIMDFSELGSLGGGCAKIIREAATAGEVVVCVVGASKTIRNFLEKAGETPIIYESDQDGALDKIGAAQPQPAREDRLPVGPAQVTEPKAANRSVSTPPATKAAADVIDLTPDQKLKRQLLRYHSLFTLSSDFGQIREKTGLLEAFLLTTISHAGTECAAFLERTDESFRLTAWKGFETADPGAFTLDLDDVDQRALVKSPRVLETNESPISNVARKKVVDWGMPYVAPFIIHGKLEGLVILGNPIREGLDEAVCEFLMMLIDQTAIAYRNSQQVEQENKRTLGIVRSLMSMIGDHTLSRGDMEIIVDYVHAVAVATHYPEAHIRDLMHGTMLRDVGMIKVSELIVQSDRELKGEEWTAIKRHPVDGSDMLRSMGLSDHTCDIVLFHHERFNGGGYPQGVRGTQIPLGARIVSVVESYAVMLQERPTRPAFSSEQSLSTLKENLGKRYDPDIVAAFVEIVEEEIRTGRKANHKNRELLGVKG
jgi:hypothetical protein